MDLLPIHSHATIQIKSVEDDSVTINDHIYRHSLIALPDRLIDRWPVHHIHELTIPHLETLVDLKPEILLIGTGTTLCFPTPKILNWLRAHRVGSEFMDTRAACRTFQLLTTENRRVVAALIIYSLSDKYSPVILSL